MAKAKSEVVFVGMRMRPIARHEDGQKPCLRIRGNQIDVIFENLSRDDQVRYEGQGPFTFDVVMDSSLEPRDPCYCNNDTCYDLVGRPLVDFALAGYNACVFCYGQIGTGKTATIMGDPYLGKGLLPRTLGDVCGESAKMRSDGSQVSLTVQMFEVYNGGIKDLLQERGKWDDLKIKAAVMPAGVSIKGAREEHVSTAGECLKILDDGAKRRTVASTNMSPTSSRGHMVFKLTIHKSRGKLATELYSEMYFADLAGIDSIETTEVTGQCLDELGHINVSLRAISDMVKNLGKNGQQDNFSPFRNSELTMLLANGLYGNSKASAVVTLSPAARHFDTSFNAIGFALELKRLKLNVKTDVAPGSVEQIEALKAEVVDLKRQLALAQSASAPAANPTVDVQLRLATSTAQQTVFGSESAGSQRGSWRENLKHLSHKVDGMIGTNDSLQSHLSEIQQQLQFNR